MATNWNEYRKQADVVEEKNVDGVCDKTAPLFLEMLEQPFYSRKELGGEMAKMLQAILNDKHHFDSKSHSACARHVIAMESVLRALTTRGEFKIGGLVYKVAPVVAPSVPAAPIIAPQPQPKK